MTENNELKLKLKNIEGKRLLEKTRLEYSKEIINEIEKNSNILPELLQALEITETEFFSYLSGEEHSDITVYDQALVLIKSMNQKNNISNE